MAKASSTTSVYEVRSQFTGETLQVTERAYRKFQKTNNRIVKTDLRAESCDRSGREYERTGLGFKCLSTDEVFDIVEQARSIRKETE